MRDTNQLPILDGRAWLGVADAYGTRFIIQLWEDPKHAGYYHYAFSCVDDTHVDESTRPIGIAALEVCGTSLIVVVGRMVTEQHGVTLDEFDWAEKPVADLPYSTAGGDVK